MNYFLFYFNMWVSFYIASLVFTNGAIILDGCSTGLVSGLVMFASLGCGVNISGSDSGHH